MSISREREGAGIEPNPPCAVEREMTVLRLFRDKDRDLAESWPQELRLRGGKALEEANRVVGVDHAVVNRLVSCHA